MADDGFRHSSKPPRFTPDAVASALSALAEQIKAVSQEPGTQFRVAKAVAFGDFLSDRGRVQAPDVGVLLVPQEPENDQPSSPTGQAARRQFLGYLRGRTAILSVRPYEEWMSSRTHRRLA
jgi:hypothetical protein